MAEIQLGEGEEESMYTLSKKNFKSFCSQLYKSSEEVLLG